MFCGKCGTKLPDNALFCMKCGSAVSNLVKNVVPINPNPTITFNSESSVKLIPVKCPYCGASASVNPNGQNAMCQFCGTQFLIQDAIQRIQISTTVKTINNDFETKLANAENWADNYFRGVRVIYKNSQGIDAVLKYYYDAESVGGSGETRYWLSISRFIYRAVLNTTQLIPKKRNDLISSYENSMDFAIKYSNDKELLLQEKKECFNKLVEIATKDFDHLLEKAEKAAKKLCENTGLVLVTYDTVISYYAAAELAGGMFLSKYWLSYSRFFFYAIIELEKRRAVRLKNKDEAIRHYNLCMTNAIKYSENDQSKLQKKKKKNTQLLIDSLPKKSSNLW